MLISDTMCPTDSDQTQNNHKEQVRPPETLVIDRRRIARRKPSYTLHLCTLHKAAPHRSSRRRRNRKPLSNPSPSVLAWALAQQQRIRHRVPSPRQEACAAATEYFP